MKLAMSKQRLIATGIILDEKHCFEIKTITSTTFC
jgi:hypothetical protein